MGSNGGGVRRQVRANTDKRDAGDNSVTTATKTYSQLVLKRSDTKMKECVVTKCLMTKLT